MGQLNELQIKAAAPRDKEYLLADGDGLYLRVRPTGKAWVYRYKRHGKEAKLSIGHYPVVTLAAARRKARAEAEKRAEPARPVGFDQALLDRFETMNNPYVAWPVHQVLPSRPDCTVFQSATQSGDAVIVKVWNGLRRGTSVAIDMALYRLLDSVARLSATPITGLPSYMEGALSPVGPYIVYEHCVGQKLSDIESYSEEEGLEVARALITTVIQLNGLECEHGDISPANAVFDREQRSFKLLDAFDVTAVGQGSMRTPALCPENWETWTQQSLDRYACLKTVEHVLRRSAGECVSEMTRLLASELCRPSLESLDPVAHAISTQLDQKSRSPSRISISTPANTYGFEGGAGFFLQSQTTGEGQERITLTNSGGQLVMEGDHDKVKRHYFQQPAFQTLAHQSRTGRPLDISVAVTPGREEGVDELYRLLKAPLDVSTHVMAFESHGAAVGSTASPPRRSKDVRRLTECGS
jgi:hypothetical protein